MLLCRVYENESDKKVFGSCNINEYREGGWFPINSFTFGFESKDKAGGNKAAGGKGGATGGNTGAKQGGAPAAPPQQKGSSDSGSGTEESKIGISKPVDTGTCDLMKLAMQDRKKTKGRESKLQADIHLLSFIEISGGARATFPNLMVHLEGVLVRNWQVNASGDDRAEETLDLQYDRAAMKYVSTRDGKVFMAAPARGWDQTEDKEFDWGSNWDKFTKNMQFVARK